MCELEICVTYIQPWGTILERLVQSLIGNNIYWVHILEFLNAIFYEWYYILVGSYAHLLYVITIDMHIAAIHYDW